MVDQLLIGGRDAILRRASMTLLRAMIVSFDTDILAVGRSVILENAFSYLFFHFFLHFVEFSLKFAILLKQNTECFE